jgi:hypothetical protein
MVAVIKSSSSIHRILNYNENKVKQEKASCIGAFNYPVDAHDLTFTMKLIRFERQMELNTNTKRNSVHISLNFDASEKDMPTAKLLQVAEDYMERIGFGQQPYLVYRHTDAGHPHIHVVTTNITADGSRIDLHHLAIRKSEPARKAIELAYGLVRAQGKKNEPASLRMAGASRVTYGVSETRAALQNVLEAVLNKYRFTSLPEFNAVLGLYNVSADTGSEGSRVRRHGGLLYRILDEKGNAVGIPIKASLFHSSPTLANITRKFSTNSIMGQQHKARIKNAIDIVDQGTHRTGLSDLRDILNREGISLVRRENSEGMLYGITYVDHRTGAVFNGSALGKEYSAKLMQERFPELGMQPRNKVGEKPAADVKSLFAGMENLAAANPASAPLLQEIMRIAEGLTRPEQASDYVPGQLKRKKKRKKQGPSNNY